MLGGLRKVGGAVHVEIWGSGVCLAEGNVFDIGWGVEFWQFWGGELWVSQDLTQL